MRRSNTHQYGRCTSRTFRSIMAKDEQDSKDRTARNLRMFLDTHAGVFGLVELVGVMNCPFFAERTSAFVRYHDLAKHWYAIRLINTLSLNRELLHASPSLKTIEELNRRRKSRYGAYVHHSYVQQPHHPSQQLRPIRGFGYRSSSTSSNGSSRDPQMRATTGPRYYQGGVSRGRGYSLHSQQRHQRDNTPDFIKLSAPTQRDDNQAIIDKLDELKSVVYDLRDQQASSQQFDDSSDDSSSASSSRSFAPVQKQASSASHPFSSKLSPGFTRPPLPPVHIKQSPSSLGLFQPSASLASSTSSVQPGPSGITSAQLAALQIQPQQAPPQAATILQPVLAAQPILSAQPAAVPQQASASPQNAQQAPSPSAQPSPPSTSSASPDQDHVSSRSRMVLRSMQHRSPSLKRSSQEPSPRSSKNPKSSK